MEAGGDPMMATLIRVSAAACCGAHNHWWDRGLRLAYDYW